MSRVLSFTLFLILAFPLLTLAQITPAAQTTILRDGVVSTRLLTVNADGSINVNSTGGASGGYAQGSATTGQLILLFGCAAANSSPSFMDGNSYAASCGPNGAIRVDASGTPFFGAGTLANSDPVNLASEQFGLADAKATATDTTQISLMAVLKEISSMEQNPASRAVTQATAANLNAAIVGATAIGSTYTGNPINNGCKGVNAEQTAVTNGQEQAMPCDLVGKLIVIPYANPENFVNGTVVTITDTTSTATMASAGGSLRNYVTHCTISNSHATVGTQVQILDGTTVLDQVYAGPLGGGASLPYPVPLKGTAATAINIKPVTTGANVVGMCNGYKGL